MSIGFKPFLLFSQYFACILHARDIMVSNVLLLVNNNFAHIRSMNIFKSDGTKRENLRLSMYKTL